MKFETCGAPLPWGTTCRMDRDHNDHYDGLSPRWHSGLDDVAERDARIASLEAVVKAVRDLFEVTPMSARRLLADSHPEVNRAWLALDATLSPEPGSG